MVVLREYSGMTPAGMSFTTLAGSVGGGVQTPGFLGVGKLYLVSKKFISAEGGLRRLVWMPKELKELLKDKLQARAKEIGEPGWDCHSGAGIIQAKAAYDRLIGSRCSTGRGVEEQLERLKLENQCLRELYIELAVKQRIERPLD